MGKERPQRPRDWPRSGSSLSFFRSLPKCHLPTKALLTTSTAPNTPSLLYVPVLFYAEHLSLSEIILIMSLHAFDLCPPPPLEIKFDKAKDRAYLVRHSMPHASPRAEAP